ncbi:outer membrane beta-barrel protein [Methylophaga sp.]|uniref:outer membrane beta-barrel protein n=1 Tax=Methylophaga sp. TaxID=2024840 RepID=UPI002727B3C5|nr:outer membrane beta-barrel protein [Methylophaga sp.]MDO8827601.1 outer membrane beta-barrel protein [Methylophaga sp.]
MKNPSLKLLVLPLLASFAAPVFSGEFYLGANVGQAKSSDFCSEVSDDLSSLSLTRTSCDDSDSAYKIFAGYSFTENWAVEGAYADLGEFSIDYTDGSTSGKAKAELDAVSIAMVGKLPLTDDFNLFAKLGLYHSNTDASATFGGVRASDDDSSTDGLFGLGASYSLTESLAIRAEWERYMDSDADIDLMSVGLMYTFN